jgi:hypothetical protein
MMITYDLAQYAWADAAVIYITSRADQLIGTFPLEFVRLGGVNTWGYVLDVVLQLVDCGEGVIVDEGGRIVETTEVPHAGQFWFEPAGE